MPAEQGDERTILLEVGAEGENLKLNWYVPHLRFAYRYLVGRGPIDSKSADIRHLLGQFSIHCMERDAQGLRPDYASFLPRLRTESEMLRNLLFLPDRAAQRQQARDVQAALRDERARRASLSIQCYAPVHIPWGFVAAEWLDPPATAPATRDEEMQFFDGLWGSRFRINVAFTEDPPPPRRTWPRSDFRVLSVLNGEELRKALGHLAPEQEQVRVRDTLERLFRMPEGDATSWDRAYDHWKNMMEKPCALYIFGHCDGKSFFLSDEAEDSTGRMSVDNFKAAWISLREPTAPPVILFLNGCRSAAGEHHRSFVHSAWAPGHQGCIATEAEVPNAFAARYGTRFMDLVSFAGYTVGEAFETLRDDPALFPLSRLYACFANPDFQVEKADELAA